MLNISESEVKLLSNVQLFATPWNVAYQAPPSMGFSRQECRVDCHFLLQGIFPTQESNPGLLRCRQTVYHLSHRVANLCEQPKQAMDMERNFTKEELINTRL